MSAAAPETAARAVAPAAAAAASLHPGGLALTARALAACRFAPGARVLDVGCGPGATLGLLRAAGLRASGIDRSPRSLALAAQGGAAGLVRGDDAALPIAPASLDGVLLECVLSLAPDPLPVLAECARALAPGGRLVLSDLYARGPGPAPAPAVPICGGRLLSRAQLAGALGAAGLALLLWEDQTPALAAFAAERLLAPAGWGARGRPAADLLEAVEQGRRVRAGYFLCVARRERTGAGGGR